MASHSDEARGPKHGGDLAFATMRYARPRSEWLDLSTGINPLPYPVPDIAAATLAPLPDRGKLASLIAAARAAYGVATDVAVAAVPGTELAIRLLPQAAPPGPVAIVSPTYGSHSDAWRRSARLVSEVRTIADVPADAAVVVVSNPNNPDGRVCRPDALGEVGQRIATRGGVLVVDEAYADVAPELSMAPRLNAVPCLVLRSLGKFYGLAGVRLGFVAGAASFVERIAGHIGDWPVSTVAIVAGMAALTDGAWREATSARLTGDAARLRHLLSRHRLTVVGGTDLFVLVENDDAGNVHHALAGRGIWTRCFDDQPKWIRFGLPADDAGFRRLDDALREIR